MNIISILFLLIPFIFFIALPVIYLVRRRRNRILSEEFFRPVVEDTLADERSSPVRTGESSRPETLAEEDSRRMPVERRASVRSNTRTGIDTVSGRFNNSEDRPDEDTVRAERKTDSLSRLKKAVIWAEILGKPKGLED